MRFETINIYRYLFMYWELNNVIKLIDINNLRIFLPQETLNIKLRKWKTEYSIWIFDKEKWENVFIVIFNINYTNNKLSIGIDLWLPKENTEKRFLYYSIDYQEIYYDKEDMEKILSISTTTSHVAQSFLINILEDVIPEYLPNLIEVNKADIKTLKEIANKKKIDIKDKKIFISWFDYKNYQVGLQIFEDLFLFLILYSICFIF